MAAQTENKTTILAQKLERLVCRRVSAVCLDAGFNKQCAGNSIEATSQTIAEAIVNGTIEADLNERGALAKSFASDWGKLTYKQAVDALQGDDAESLSILRLVIDAYVKTKGYEQWEQSAYCGKVTYVDAVRFLEDLSAGLKRIEVPCFRSTEAAQAFLETNYNLAPLVLEAKRGNNWAKLQLLTLISTFCEKAGNLYD